MEGMSVRTSELLYRSKEIAKSLRRDSLQAAKRTILGWGVVPPPLRVQIDITDGCNFCCPTCSKWHTPASPRELCLTEWTTILERIAALPLLGEIAVTGGEPLMRADLLPFVAQAKRHGLRVVLISNGWFLDRVKLDALEAAGVDRVTVSLNSLQPQLHDQTRGKPGSHVRILQCISAWQAVPRVMELCLATLVMQSNCGELTSLARFAREQGLTGIIFQVLAPPEAHYAFAVHDRMPQTQRAWIARDPLWVTDLSELRVQVHDLLQMQGQGCHIHNAPSQLRNFPAYYGRPEDIVKLPCLGTLSRLYVDPFGDARLCYGFPAIGNVLHDDPRRLWKGTAARQIRTSSRKCDRLCRMLNNNQ